MTAKKRVYQTNCNGFSQVYLLNNLKENFEILTLSKAYILGVLCGDGYILKNGIALGVTDLDFSEYFSKKVEEVYGLITKRYVSPPKFSSLPLGRSCITKTVYATPVHSILVKQDILKYDESGKGFKTKTWAVPKEVLNSKDWRILAMFAKGFFDSEGSVNIRWVEGYSASFKGIKGIQEILSRLNIKSNIRKIKRYYEIYQISIYSKPSQKIFREKIGFSIQRKSDKLDKILQPTEKYKYTPEQYYRAVELKKKGLSKGKISRILGIKECTISDWIHRKRGVIPLSVRNTFKDDRFSQLNNKVLEVTTLYGE